MTLTRARPLLLHHDGCGGSSFWGHVNLAVISEVQARYVHLDQPTISSCRSQVARVAVAALASFTLSFKAQDAMGDRDRSGRVSLLVRNMPLDCR